jgi:phospholipid/cholesterol/gamma-HCH transport system ATP-binding protein
MDASASAIATPRAPVLEFAGARVPLDEGGGLSQPLDLCLTSGDLMLIEVEDRQQSARIADAAAGLTMPLAGEVRFLERNWTDVPALHACAMRGRIGHVFTDGNWLAGLSLLDNILLPQLYHTRRMIAELRDEAARLASLFGLPGLPLDNVAALPAFDLDRAACVRAFLGRPQLLILEHPAERRSVPLLEPLVNAVRAARDRGAAVLWFTGDQGMFFDSSIPVDLRLRLRNGALRTVARRQ